MRLLSIGDCVKPGTYRLHSCFRRAVNYVHRGRLVSVVDESIGPGPLNVVIRGWPAAPGGKPAARGSGGCLRLEVSHSVVLFAGRSYPFTARHRYDSTLSCPVVDPRRLRRNLAIFGELLRETAPPHSLAFLLHRRRLKCFRAGFERAFAAQIQQGVQQAFHGDLLKGVAELKGCGVGLTPSGDDFIAGLLIGLNFLQMLRSTELQRVAVAVCRAARGSSLFSNTAMELTREGLLFGRVKAVLLALVSGNALSLRQTVKKLLTVGASSGADLATGLFLTLHLPDGTLQRWRTETTAPAGKTRWKTATP